MVYCSSQSMHHTLMKLTPLLCLRDWYHFYHQEGISTNLDFIYCHFINTNEKYIVLNVKYKSKNYAGKPSTLWMVLLVVPFCPIFFTQLIEKVKGTPCTSFYFILNCLQIISLSFFLELGSNYFFLFSFQAFIFYQTL